MPSIVGLLALGLAGLGAAGWWYRVLDSRSRAMLASWAQGQGLDLLQVELKPFLKGPYWFSSKAQMVYRISVRQADGSALSGWARCGGAVLGPGVDKVAVRWDEQTTSRSQGAAEDGEL